MGNRNERLWKLEEKALTEQMQLNGEQIALIEKSNPCFRERLHASNRPGEILAQDTILVGFLKGVGKIYLQSVVDTYNSFTFGFLHLGKLPDCAVAILHNDVLPFYCQHNLQIQTIVTNNGREYCGTEKHHYELYLMLSGIEHRKTKLRDNHTHGFIKRFNQIVLDEFLKEFFQNKYYDTIEKLQSDFDQWLLYYNNERPHQGYRNMGLPPIDIFKNYLRYLDQ
jgi:transposase InsO family protein